jgi:hypothetical protein
LSEAATVSAPEDQDNDFIDDLWELTHPYLNPLNPNDAFQLSPELDRFAGENNLDYAEYRAMKFAFLRGDGAAVSRLPNPTTRAGGAQLAEATKVGRRMGRTVARLRDGRPWREPAGSAVWRQPLRQRAAGLPASLLSIALARAALAGSASSIEGMVPRLRVPRPRRQPQSFQSSVLRTELTMPQPRLRCGFFGRGSRALD